MATGHLANHRELIHHPLVQLLNRELFSAPRHDLRSLLRDNRRHIAGLLQQLDPHPIACVELLPFIARFRIVHTRIRQHPIDIRRKQANVT